MGRNGVGKTTTIRSIVGFSPPTARDGSLSKDVDVTRWPVTDREERHQSGTSGAADLPVSDGRRTSSRLRPEAATAPANMAGIRARILSLFPALEQRMKQKGSALSGGEQQMLAIARALLTNPQLLLMDEPSEGLVPPRSAARRRGDRASSREGGTPILLVEQNLSLALTLADYIYVMNKGRIVFEGPAEELAHVARHPTHLPRALSAGPTWPCNHRQRASQHR